jgi:hypothetical protein
MENPLKEINENIQTFPLTKKEFKQHFFEKTKELDLKHTFDVDEAYEIGQEIVRRKNFRSKIVEFENNLNKNSDVLSKKEIDIVNPVKETFAGGCYIREIFNPANELIITKIHKKEHPFFLLEGKMSILTENGVQHLQAPYSGITKPGTKRIIYTHTDCVFTTVHSVNSTNKKEIMEEIVAENFDDPAISLEEIKKLKQNINNKTE